jgi:beta-lactamase superfamily II metal-dependent hydrolase
MAWHTSLDTFIWIFNVGRGSAAFIRTPLNQGMIFDISCSKEFSTSDFIIDNLAKKLSPYKESIIAQAVLTHPHHDHISDCGPLADGKKLHPALLTCPNDKDPKNAVKWERIKNIDGNKSLTAYRSLFAKRNLPLQTIQYESKISPVADLEYGIYYLQPPKCDALHSIDNEYGNALSIVSYFRYGKNSILLPGDVTPEAMERILAESEGVEKRFTVFRASTQKEHPKWTTETIDQPSLKSRISTYGLSILVAPHHGLESCYSSSLQAAIRDGKPDLVAISERQAPGENQGKIHQNYQSKEGAKGLKVTIAGKVEDRYSVTTKGHHILIRFNGSGVPKVYCEERIEDLMKWADA